MDIESIKIKLERKGADSKPHYRITIHGNGKIIYDGIENVEVKGKVESKITEEEIINLLDDLKKSGFFLINNNYNIYKKNQEDIVSLSFTYTDENNIIKTKKISHVSNDPRINKNLEKFEKNIDELIESNKLLYKNNEKKKGKKEKIKQGGKSGYKKKTAIVVLSLLIIFILILIYFSTDFFDFNKDTIKDNEEGKLDIINDNNNTSMNTSNNPKIIFITTTNQSSRKNSNRPEQKSVFYKNDTIYVDFEFTNITHNNIYNLTVEITVNLNEEEYYNNKQFYSNNNTYSDVFFLIYNFTTDKSWSTSSYNNLYSVNIKIYDNITKNSTNEKTLFYLLNNKSSFWTSKTLESAILGGNYLINATNNGFFVYEYNPISDTKSSSYNILRHAGTIYSMLQLYNITKNKNILNAAEDAIDFLLLFEKPYDNNSTCIVYNDKVKLGGAGLTIIALAEHAKTTGKYTYLSNMQNLAKYIEISQEESGKFISKRYYSSGEIDDWDSLYYPGEAILGLCRLYSLDKNETWLNVAEKGSKYLIELRKDIPTDDLVHDHWLMMALNELYRYRDNLSYFNHSIRLAKSIMNGQRDNVNEILDNIEWLGSYYTPPRSTPTATRSEGLIAAYHLSNDLGNKKSTNQILSSIKLGIQFQLQTQFNDSNIINLSNPQKALGGFHESLTDYNIRIDYVQHNICSMIGLYKIIRG